MEKMARAVMENAGFDENDVIMAHELTHALQDQHFGLKNLPMDVDDDDDRVIASQALVEGDATVAMTAWMFKKMRVPVTMLFSKRTAASIDKNLDLKSIPGAAAVATAPAFIRESLLFPYAGGAKFCLSLCLDEKGFLPVDRAFAAPPLVVGGHRLLRGHVAGLRRGCPARADAGSPLVARRVPKQDSAHSDDRRGHRARVEAGRG